jgi:hypothetical protein
MRAISLTFPAMVSAKQPTAKNKVVSAIMANAIKLTKEDAETLLALATHLQQTQAIGQGDTRRDDQNGVRSESWRQSGDD